MNYQSNILELFFQRLEQDRSMYAPDWVIGWGNQDKAKEEGEAPTDDTFYQFQNFLGPGEITDWWEWNSATFANYFPEEMLRPLMERVEAFDKRVTNAYGISYDFHSANYQQVIAKNNAQDYLMANAYHIPGPKLGRRVLDFGSGVGRQACLWNLLEDEGLTYLSMDAIPKSYCMQHFYYSNFDRPYHDYVVNAEECVLDKASRGIYHLPTWRLDLIPDNYLDKIMAVQVLPELSEILLKHVVTHFQRILKPGGAFYVRDHKDLWKPVHGMNIDDFISQNGFTKEFEAHLEDRVEFHGVPRIYRKTKPGVKTTY